MRRLLPTILMALFLTAFLATVVRAAEPRNPIPPIAQPQGSPVYWSQFMLRMLATYRIVSDPTRLNYLEAASGAAAAGAAATGAASSATAAGPR